MAGWERNSKSRLARRHLRPLARPAAGARRHAIQVGRDLYSNQRSCHSRGTAAANDALPAGWPDCGTTRMARLIALLARWLGRQLAMLLLIVAVLLGGAWLKGEWDELRAVRQEIARDPEANDRVCEPVSRFLDRLRQPGPADGNPGGTRRDTGAPAPVR